MNDAEEGFELQDDYGTPPIWINKLEEAQYTMSKLKPKLDELSSLHGRCFLRPILDDSCEEEALIENSSMEISKLISTAHRLIQHIQASLGYGQKSEQSLTKNVVTYLILSLQGLTIQFRNSQNMYLREINSREERSNEFFETNNFTTIDLCGAGMSYNTGNQENTAVESFDNFLQPKSVNYKTDDSDEQIDEYFQKSISQKMTQQQLLLFEEDNTKVAENREQEVSKIVKSIVDLHDIFKDLSHMVVEQGTVLDRIDYNIESTQTKIFEGFRQLQKAEIYQRKNRKIICILLLASITFLMIILIIFKKF